MKQSILDLAAQLTPFTTQIAYAGAIILFIGWLALFIWVIRHRGTGLLRLAGRLLILLGVLFLAFQVAAFALGLDTTTNFEGAWVNLHRKPFWLVGMALLIPGFVLRLVGSIRPTH
jgi:hypothetical protein